MRFILLVLCALFIGCEQGYETRVIEQGDDVAKKEKVKEEKPDKVEPKMLAEIDEDIVYIWADDTKRVYFGNELPEGGGHPTPHQFFYTDGTVADVVAFEYYRPDRHFYFKVHEYEEVKENGITVGWNDVYRIFRQKKHKMEEAPRDTVFPAYEPVDITDYTWDWGYVGKNNLGEATLFPADPQGIKNGSCSYEFVYFSCFVQNGDTLWVTGEKKGVDHSQLFMVEPIVMGPTRWLDYAKAVFKP